MTAGAEAPVRQTLFERVFVTLLILKGLDGILEIVGGILLATVPARALTGWVAALTQRELSEDPVTSSRNTCGQQRSTWRGPVASVPW